DGIRVLTVTGVQTCALPICDNSLIASDLAYQLVEQQVKMEQEREELIRKVARYQAVVAEEKRLNKQLATYKEKLTAVQQRIAEKIGRASCRERGNLVVFDRA